VEYRKEVFAMPTIPTRVADRLKSSLKEFQGIVQAAKSRDVNESDTVIIVTDMLSAVFGYEKYSEVTSELDIRGTHCDLATKVDGKIQALIEVKAVGTELKNNHIRQAVDYSANSGIEWVVLTNTVRWQVYRVIFSRPVGQELILDFDLLSLNPKKDEDIEKVYLLAKEGWGKSALEEFDTQRQALNRFSLGAVLTSDPILKLVRRQLRRMSPEAKFDLEQIKTVLLQEVLKRDVIEGEKADEAHKRVARVNRKARSKVVAEEVVPATAAAASGQ
jgi:hypothetical protein